MEITKNFLQEKYGNLMEKVAQKYDKIIVLDWVPEEHKKIALEIRIEEMKELRQEYFQELEKIS